MENVAECFFCCNIATAAVFYTHLFIYLFYTAHSTSFRPQKAWKHGLKSIAVSAALRKIL